MKRLTDEASVHDWNLNSEGPKKARVLGTNCEELIRLEQVGARTDEVRVLNTIDSSEIRRVENGPVTEEDRALGRSGIVERIDVDHDRVLVRSEIVERKNFDRQRTDFDHDRVFERGEIVQGMDFDRDRVLGRIEMVGRMDVDHDRVLGNVGLSSACGDSTPSESIAAVGSGKGKAILDFDLNVERMDFDLNLAAAEEEEEGSGLGFQDYSPVGPVVVALERVDIIHISSDESEVDDTGEKGCITLSGGRRYTREEKGKAKLVDSHSWLSLAMPMQFDLITERQELIEEHRDSQREETTQVLETEIVQIVREPEPMAEQESRQVMCANRYRDVARDNALRFARFNSNQKNSLDPLSQETQVQTIEETDKNVDNFVGPFSAALRLMKERNLKSSAEQLINWKPSEGFDRNVVMPLVPSLLDLSMKVLAKNAEAIVSLEYVPDALKHRLADMLCDSRKMNAHALDLLVQGSPTEIRVKDCSWLTDEHFTQIFGSFDSKSLKVLQLDLCGQCVHGDSLCRTIQQSQNSLPDLGILSLKGACRLTDVALKALVASTPALRSINLGECSLLTDTSISFLAACLGATLRELYIDNCHRIDARVVAHAILEFKHLEVLSVSGIQTVCDEFVVEVITKCGRNIKGLDLADCVKLTNTSMEVIGNTCSGLCFLNISNLHNLTDLAIQYLSNGCLSIQTLKLRQTSFSDEAIAAFLETSGKSLKELSLNNVRKVGPNTALSLAKSSKELLSLDLSWCRKITNEAVGLIVDSCPSLKLVRLFGCTQISNEFLNGHSNTQVNIIGLNLTPILEHLNMLETEVGYL